MDIIAEKLRIDPLELRLKNYRQLGEIDPVLNQEIRSNGLQECLEKGAESSGWKEKRRQKPIKGVFITHGEKKASDALAGLLREEMGMDALVPAYRQTVELS